MTPRWIWPAVRDAIRVLGPGLVVLENVRGHLGRGFPGVLGDLAAIGYDVRWCCVRASDVGAPHRRERLFVVAYPADPDDVGYPWGWNARHGRPRFANGGIDTPDSGGPRRQGQGQAGPLRRSGTQLRAVAHTTDGEGWNTQRACAPAAGRQERDDAGRGRMPLVAHPEGDGRHEGRPEPEGQLRRPDDALGRDAATERWGQWAPAIERWERRLTRPAPDAVELGPKGNLRLNAAFSEWMMGLPAGWVTGIMATSADPRREPSKISRAAALRLIGNGVVPQQGAAALRWLLDDTHPEFSEGPGRYVLD